MDILRRAGFLSRQFSSAVQTVSLQSQLLSNPYLGFNSSNHRNIHITTAKLRMTQASGNRMSWKLTTDLINQSTTELITKNKEIYESVGALKPEEITYDSVIKVFNNNNNMQIDGE